MGFFTDKLPQSVQIDGVSVQIHTDFRIVLAIDELEGDEAVRGLTALLLFYGDHLPADMEAARDQLLWFLRCGQVRKELEISQKPTKPAFSFSHDGALIYAAVMEQYGIDLIEIPYLHWWAFRALFDGLSPDCRFSEICRCRTINLSDVKDKAMRNYYREMQKRYALPDEGRQQLDAIADALLHGGDVSKLL